MICLDDSMSACANCAPNRVFACKIRFTPRAFDKWYLLMIQLQLLLERHGFKPGSSNNYMSCIKHFMIAPQKVVKRLLPVSLTAGSCSSLQPGAITI